MKADSFQPDKIETDRIIAAIKNYLYDDLTLETIRDVIIDHYKITDDQYRELFSIAYFSL